MGEKTLILQFRFMGVITTAGTARLYHISAKSAMREKALILQFCIMGVITCPQSKAAPSGMEKAARHEVKMKKTANQ